MLVEPTPAVPASSASVATKPSAEPVLAGPALRFVVAPTVEPDVIRSEMASFARWLGISLGRPIEIVVADSYQDCGDRLIAGTSEFGLLPPLLFVQTVAREPRVQPVVLRLFDGSRGSDGYILVRDDTKLTGAADLRGRNVCFVDRESTTGFLLPRIWMRSAGLDPDKDVTSVFSGDHLAVMRDLEAEKCDAAAVYSGAFLSAGPQGIRVGAMRVLAITGRVPQDVVSAAPDVPEADVKRWRDLLTGFKPERDIDAGRIGTVLGITGFAPFDPKELELIRQAAESEGMLNSASGAP
jgi:phosphonate transport system substrate-binding protein